MPALGYHAVRACTAAASYSGRAILNMEQDEQLIELVKAYPCLYDTKSADFKIVLKKENAWKAIASVLAKTGQSTLICYYILLLKPV